MLADPQVTWAPRNWPLDLDQRGFRLPTESEWEVVVRSGSRTAYGFGSEVALLDRFGWFIENSGKHVHPPRELRPSVRGLVRPCTGICLSGRMIGTETSGNRVADGSSWC